MALYPKAIKRLIPAGANDPAIHPVGIVLHVAVSEADSLHDYFDGPSGGIESHFYVRRDGTVEQYRDTSREADANYRANSWVASGRRVGMLSVETQGMGHGEWTPEQIEALKDLILWAAREHGFALRRAQNPFSGGVGYHVMFGAPSAWTPHVKSCPGPDRIRQFDSVIVPWMNSDPDKPHRKPTRLDRIRNSLTALVKKARANGNDKRAKAIAKARNAIPGKRRGK